jgi:16S rRNA (uracil1498-N3)-methyltransferase
MPAYRFFVSHPLAEKSTISLSGSEYSHFRKVLRGEVGDTLEFVNGSGDLATGEITAMTKEEATAVIRSVVHATKELFELTLAIAYFKPQNLDFAIEKATELGASAFFLFPGDKSEKKNLSENGLHRLETIVQAACKQCGRLYVPTISTKNSLKECLSPNQLIFFGDIAPDAPKLEQVALPQSGKAIFVIGPEAGFSSKEVAELRAHGAQGLSLHKNILRAETAVMAATLLCQP